MEKLFIVETEVEKVKTRYYYKNREKAVKLYEHFCEMFKLINDHKTKSVKMYSDNFSD